MQDSTQKLDPLGKTKSKNFISRERNNKFYFKTMEATEAYQR